ncbi:MAG: glycosyltransferase [Dehalococcoidia bacterium]|nr:glycosyltransferase [Dehalococcoidia bacterium]MCB9484096.1 glycosyltransferase [Dehalococcoidia bacterium]
MTTTSEGTVTGTSPLNRDVRPERSPQGEATGQPRPTRLYAVVATYRRPNIAREAIDALLRQTRPPDGIVLVENSPDWDFRGIYDAGEVEVIHTGWNAGAAGGFGIGTQVALERGATHVVLVDDDCILREDTLAGIEHAVTEQVPGAVVGPAIVTDDGESLVWNIYRPNGKPYARASELPDYPVPTRDLAFHGLTASAEAIRAAGGPRSDLFFGGPDVEYCLRLADHGYQVFYLPHLRATHHAANYRRFWFLGSRRVPAGSPGHRYYVLRNRLLMWRMYRRDSVLDGIAKVVAREVVGALLAGDRVERLRLLGRAVRDAASGDPRRKMTNAVPLR